MKFKLRLYDWGIIALCIVLITMFLMTAESLYINILLGVISGVIVARITIERGLKLSEKENFMSIYRKLLIQNLLIYAILFVVLAIYSISAFAFGALSLIIYRNLFLNSHK